MRHNELSVDELAQELCISLTTLENEIQAINADLSASDVALRTRAGQLFVAGEESAKKRVISDLLFGETRDFFNQLELVNVYFPDIDIKELRAAIDERLKREGFFINGYSLSNLILHIAIALERCLNRFPAFDSGFRWLVRPPRRSTASRRTSWAPSRRTIW
ncbi:helix-turn-helix domain-containing protein [Collinsella intestinalis]|uniref:helix-turn-helix domain-containing protein n=1 Tax=Collinsella intestinalis TaxID=147207 RepID=UPI00195CAA55|nr:helix-turn-helix domain-containing protein [Collinsella intestinalis]